MNEEQVLNFLKNLEINFRNWNEFSHAQFQFVAERTHWELTRAIKEIENV